MMNIQAEMSIMYKYTETESRQVGGFDKVLIKGNTCSAQLFITQGEQEALTIEAPPEYMHRLRSEVKDGKLTVRLHGSWLQELEDALTTCVNRPHICYRLLVTQLTSLEVQCADKIYIPGLETPYLQLKLNATGDFRLDNLSTDKLDVSHSGSGCLRIAGQVEEQVVVLNGVGSYIARDLISQRARVRMAGTSSAIIRVSQVLDATLRGVGILEYSGHPIVSKRIYGPGQVLRVPDIRERRQ